MKYIIKNMFRQSNSTELNLPETEKEIEELLGIILAKEETERICYISKDEKKCYQIPTLKIFTKEKINQIEDYKINGIKQILSKRYDLKLQNKEAHSLVFIPEEKQELLN